MVAITRPFQSGASRSRRDVLLFTGILVLVLLGMMFSLAILGHVEGSTVMFALGTVFGYTFGFLSRFLIRLGA